MKKQKGLTLLELMIAVVLGIFITGGMIQLFVNSKQNYRVQESLSRLQENGRFAMNFIAHDIRMASYWGCLKNGLESTTNGLDTADASYDNNYHSFTQGILGGEGDADPDTLTLRGAFNNGITVIAPLPSAQLSDPITVSTNNGLVEGDIVLISDCSQADIFQITNANPGTSGTVAHTIENTLEPGNANIADPGCGPTTQCLSRIYQDDAAIYKISTIAYSIQDGASGERALFRKIDGGTDQELIEGIEDIQILYGVDTLDADTSPNYYVDADDLSIALMDDVVSIRISLLARSLDNNIATQAVPYTIFGIQTTPTDRRIRRVFTSTIAVRNRLP